VARDAEVTIARALLSAVVQGPYPVLVVDDGSLDRTAERAVSVAPNRIELHRLPSHRTLGHARQLALEAIRTPFAVWLDADDEMLPGRVERLVSAMADEGTDLAFDGAELYDGPTGAPLGLRPIPAFLRSSRVLARLFERNHLPAIGPLACRVGKVRRVGYDAHMHAAEDLDLVLRAVVAGAEASLLADTGYRIHAYPSSLSRQTHSQRGMTRYGLLKHPYSVVESLYRRAGLGWHTTLWGLVWMAVFREDWPIALEWLDVLEERCVATEVVMEPDGPCPYPEGWRLSFQRGTIELVQGRPEVAAHCLRAAELLWPSAEGANNLGVACLRSGDPALAAQLFATALERNSCYHDAQRNLASPGHGYVTTHPLRVAPASKSV